MRGGGQYQEFEKEKIVWQELTQGAAFAYDDKGNYLLNTAYLLVGPRLRYILGCLNSLLVEFIFSKWYCTKLGKNGTRWLYQHVVNIPIPEIGSNNEKIVLSIEQLVTQVLKAKESSECTKNFEKEINILVYSLFNLNAHEISIVENFKR